MDGHAYLIRTMTVCLQPEKRDYVFVLISNHCHFIAKPALKQKLLELWCCI